MWKDFSPRFIVSSGRTGTKFIAYLLKALFKDIDTRHEPKPNFFRLRYQFGVGNISLEEAVKKFILIKYKFYNNIRKSIYIESNPYLCWLVPVIKKVFSDYRIIHIIRDGREWIRSAISRGIEESFLFRTSLPLVPLLRIIPADKNWFQKLKIFNFKVLHHDIWRIRALDYKDDPYSRSWRLITNFERFAWKWNKINKVISEGIKDDNKAITIHFEDIFDKSSDYNGFKKILEFFELDFDWESIKLNLKEPFSNKINKTRSYAIPHWKYWENERIIQFNRIAGDLMKFYGYT